MRRGRLPGVVLAIAGLLSFAAPPPAEAANATPLLSAYTGTPAPPYSTAWIDVSDEKEMGVQLCSTSGADAVAVVAVEIRTSSRVGPYLGGLCTNPPNCAVRASRCYFTIARTNSLRLTVDSYTSGTIQGELETHPAN